MAAIPRFGPTGEPFSQPFRGPSPLVGRVIKLIVAVPLPEELERVGGIAVLARVVRADLEVVVLEALHHDTDVLCYHHHVS
jgi:hypothetical protein